MRSHPMWVRGLKQPLTKNRKNLTKSHPMWVRGLKHLYLSKVFYRGYVASYVGAWIETLTLLKIIRCSQVASYVGAWIETSIQWI